MTFYICFLIINPEDGFFNIDYIFIKLLDITE